MCRLTALRINFYVELIAEQSKRNENMPKVFFMITFFMIRLLQKSYVIIIISLLNKSVRQSMYHAYIQSHIVYLNTIWSGAPEYKLKVLQIIQNKAIKAIYNKKMQICAVRT